MKKTILVILVITILCTVGYAQSHRGDNFSKGTKEYCDRFKGDGMGEGKIEKLLPDLTDDQKIKLREIAIQFKAKVSPLKEKIHTQRVELERMIDDPSATQELINNKIDEIAMLKADIEKLYAERKRLCDKILTTEQRATLKAHREEMRPKMQK